MITTDTPSKNILREVKYDRSGNVITDGATLDMNIDGQIANQNKFAVADKFGVYL
jgi:hypothetical protein